MPEARDRLSRPEDVADMFSRRRRSMAVTGILPDEPEHSAIRHADEASRSAAIRGGSAARASIDTRRVWNRSRRSLYGSPTLYRRQNTPPGSGRRARVGDRALPSWYPRKPLQDITTVVRAFEKKRARLRDMEGQQAESPLSHGRFVEDPSASSSSAPLEHNLSMVTPKPSTLTRRNQPFVGKVSKILHEITNQQVGESEFLTPEKKLLNSIGEVQKVVLEEISRSKKTPAAKKAEREKKVRTLMSMR